MNNEIPVYGDITPYQFQWDLAQTTLSHIRKQLTKEIENEPAYINAYVSAGKTILAGIIADHCKKVGVKLLILARTGELVEQNSAEIFNMGSACSIYSASLSRKSTHFTTVVGTEGTVANALEKEFSSWMPRIILIDECHQVPWKDVLNNGDTGYSKIINHFKVLNPGLIVVGMTGSPYRGIESIKGDYWKTEIEPKIDRKFLVENNYIVPTVFGHVHDNAGYDLSEFDQVEEHGTKDFSAADMEAMHDKMDLSTTQTIMREVMEIMEQRLCALVTCAGLKHCKEAASIVPDDECAIITDKTAKKDRQQILRDAKKGKLNERGVFRYRYIFQIGCLTTGVNIPLWCTSVLLRRIASLTLLTQLLGRGMRLLKPEHVDAGHEKFDHLCVDYSGTMAAMHELFDDPLLEDAVVSGKKGDQNWVTCPNCETENSEYARRCCGNDSSSDDGRCEFFFKSRTCDDLTRGGIVISKGCGVENDIAARVCRKCDNTLIDPNDKLAGKSYGIEDWKPVISMELDVIGHDQDGIGVRYYFDSYGEDGKQEIANIKYWAIKGGGKRVWESSFIRRHITGYPFQQRMINMTPVNVIKNKATFAVPKFATHRINEKGLSVVHGLKFSSGLEIKGNKRIQNDSECT
jgi:superfamily II DNA or RNA helicase